MGECEAAPGRDVELELVPWASDDLSLHHPLEIPCSTIVGSRLEGSGHPSPAKRSGLVRAKIGERVQRAADVEDPDLAKPPDLDHLVGAGGERADIPAPARAPRPLRRGSRRLTVRSVP